MSEFAGNLPRKFISFRHLVCESSAHKVSEELDSESPQNVVEVGGTNLSPAEVMSVFSNVPISSKVGVSEEVENDHELTIAEKDCVMTSSEEDMDDLNAFDESGILQEVGQI